MIERADLITAKQCLHELKPPRLARILEGMLKMLEKTDFRWKRALSNPDNDDLLKKYTDMVGPYVHVISNVISELLSKLILDYSLECAKKYKKNILASGFFHDILSSLFADGTLYILPITGDTRETHWQNALKSVEAIEDKNFKRTYKTIMVLTVYFLYHMWKRHLDYPDRSKFIYCICSSINEENYARTLKKVLKDKQQIESTTQYQQSIEEAQEKMILDSYKRLSELVARKPEKKGFFSIYDCSAILYCKDYKRPVDTHIYLRRSSYFKHVKRDSAARDFVRITRKSVFINPIFQSIDGYIVTLSAIVKSMVLLDEVNFEVILQENGGLKISFTVDLTPFKITGLVRKGSNIVETQKAIIIMLAELDEKGVNTKILNAYPIA